MQLITLKSKIYSNNSNQEYKINYENDTHLRGLIVIASKWIILWLPKRRKIMFKCIYLKYMITGNIIVSEDFYVGTSIIWIF